MISYGVKASRKSIGKNKAFQADYRLDIRMLPPFYKGGIADRFLVFRFSAWRIKADTRLFIQGPSRYQARRDYQIPPFRKDRSINLV